MRQRRLNVDENKGLIVYNGRDEYAGQTDRSLDVPSGELLREWQRSRPRRNIQSWVGAFQQGPVPVRYLVTTGHRVFLDLKFHDIPNTVRAAAREAAELGVSMVNVHASGGRKLMEAALEGVRSTVEGVGEKRAKPQGLPYRQARRCWRSQS